MFSSTGRSIGEHWPSNPVRRMYSRQGTTCEYFAISKLDYRKIKTAWPNQEVANEGELSDFEDFGEHQASYLVPFQGYSDDSDMDIAGGE